jgi:hypothetical protein
MSNIWSITGDSCLQSFHHGRGSEGGRGDHRAVVRNRGRGGTVRVASRERDTPCEKKLRRKARKNKERSEG